MQKQRLKSDGNYVLKLAEKFGTNRAASMLGITSSGIANIRSRHSVTWGIDELARMILEQDADAGNGAHLWMVKVPDDKVEMLSEFLGALRIKFARFKE